MARGPGSCSLALAGGDDTGGAGGVSSRTDQRSDPGSGSCMTGDATAQMHYMAAMESIAELDSLAHLPEGAIAAEPLIGIMEALARQHGAREPAFRPALLSVLKRAIQASRNGAVRQGQELWAGLDYDPATLAFRSLELQLVDQGARSTVTSRATATTSGSRSSAGTSIKACTAVPEMETRVDQATNPGALASSVWLPVSMGMGRPKSVGSMRLPSSALGSRSSSTTRTAPPAS